VNPLLEVANTPELASQSVWAYLADHLDTIQLLHFFLISYLISRLFVRYKLPERFVFWVFEEKHISLSKLILIIMLSTAALSMVIANVITLLAILPVILLVQSELQGTEKEKKKLSTLIILSAMWGANIGGIGMLTGTTANGVFVGMLGGYAFETRHSFSFISWMTWAIPLAMLLCFCGWLILKAVFHPVRQLSVANIRQQLEQNSVTPKVQKIVLALAGFFLVSTALLSYLMGQFWELRVSIYAVEAVWTVVFILLLFVIPFRLKPGTKGSPLLATADVLRDLPKRGLLWILIGMTVTGILYLAGMPAILANALSSWVRADSSILLLMLLITLATIFFSEILSNLVVQIALFATLFPLSAGYPDLSWQMLLIITLATSCAFMSPIGTQVNGLGFGASRKISLPYMLGAGFLMNLVSATLITIWVHFVVPIVLKWYA